MTALTIFGGVHLSGCAGIPGSGYSGDSLGAGVISGRFCDEQGIYDASHQDRLLRFAAVVRDTLQASDASVALVSRSGLDLKRLGITLTHMGISLKEGAGSAWSVRQLYYACDESRPRLFDQGMAGFLFNTGPDETGHASVLLLPPDAALKLSRAALDPTRALALIANHYSANAYPFSTRYQNCNQWVIEMLATAWSEPGIGVEPRLHGQRWLADNGYHPQPVEVGSHLVKLAALMSPMIHLDDHPESVRGGLLFQVSLPASIESFVREQHPQTRRISFCHTQQQIVIREGWEVIDDDCSAQDGDRVVPY